MKTLPNDSKNTPYTRKGNFALKLPTVTKQSVDINYLQKYIVEWLDALRAAGKSPKTLADYKDKIGKFMWWWEVETGFSKSIGRHPKLVTRKELRQFLTYLREPVEGRWGITGNHNNKQRDRLAPASIAAYGRVVKAYFNWLEREEYIEKTPINRSVQFQPAQRDKNQEIKKIEQGDLKKVFDYLLEDRKSYHRVRNLAMLTFLLDTGVRRGELLNIRFPDDLDLDRNRCQVKGKTGQRKVAFSEGTRVVLKDYLRLRNNQEPSTSQLWLCEDDQPLSYQGINNIFRRIKKDTGVAVHAHMFRHTYGSNLAENNMNAFTLQQFMGHQSVSTTQIYVEQGIDKMQEQYNLISPLIMIPELDKALKRRRGRPRKERG